MSNTTVERTARMFVADDYGSFDDDVKLRGYWLDINLTGRWRIERLNDGPAMMAVEVTRELVPSPEWRVEPSIKVDVREITVNECEICERSP